MVWIEIIALRVGEESIAGVQNEGAGHAESVSDGSWGKLTLYPQDTGHSLGYIDPCTLGLSDSRCFTGLRHVAARCRPTSKSELESQARPAKDGTGNNVAATRPIGSDACHSGVIVAITAPTGGTRLAHGHRGR